jgi:hypothetical protein
VCGCQPVIILGAERSGTSVCAEMVHAWGAYAGEADELPAADSMNPRGRWEYLPLWDLLADVGEFFRGRSWWDAGFGDRVAAQAADPGLAARARALVAHMAAPGRPWLWKDPALCHFLGFWRPFLGSAVFVVMVRHPVDVAVSWNQLRAAGGLDTLPVKCNLARWQHMMVSVLHGIAGEPAILFAEYETVTSAPLGQARRLAAFLDQQCGTTSDPARVAQMAAVCEPVLRRHRDGWRRAGLMTGAQRSLYQFLRHKVDQPQLPATGAFPMPAGWA